MRLSLYQVDAFTDHLFGGNPAAVIPLVQWLPDQVMQNIAAENNLAETAFFVKQNEEFLLRWFTPTREVELCGHATLATAHVLYEHLNFTGQYCIFQTQKRGILKVKKLENGLMMDFPADRVNAIPEREKQIIVGALHLDPLECLKGSDDILVIVHDKAEVLNYQPDYRAIANLDARGIILSSIGDSTYDFISRCFYPKYGIDEDPVTGSAHTLLTPYWSEQLSKTRLIALQASERSGHLVCEVVQDRIHLTGKAITYLTGQITLSNGISS